MSDIPDAELLKQFVRNHSETAFAELVERHLDLVYSTALRKTDNPQHAEDVTQAVFIILARKAPALGAHTVLPGWLYHTARLTAANFQRAEFRRIHREQEAFMQSTINESTPNALWRELSPLLEDAMAGLRPTDRDAIVLRFFQNRSLAEVGAALGASEDATKMRVSRALEKLHKFFRKRGVVSTTAIIAGTISSNSLQAAPIGLANTISAAALTKGAAASISTLTLIKETSKIMAWTKTKTALVVGVSVLLAAGTAAVVISQTANQSALAAQQIAQQSEDAYAALSSYSDTGTATATVGAGPTTTTTFDVRLQRPNLYRIDWTQKNGLYVSKGGVWSEGTGNYFLMGAPNAKPEKERNMRQALGNGSAISGQATSIAEIFFKQSGGDTLGLAASGRTRLRRENDENIDSVDCFVISSVIDPAKLPNKGKLPSNRGQLGTVTTTLWIGKRDHLIHQTRTVMEGATISLPQETDADLKTILQRQNKPATPEAIAALRKQLETSMKSAQNALNSGKIVFTQTHENIVVNQKFSPTDFAR